MYTRTLLTAALLFIIGTSISVGQHSITEKTVTKTLDSLHKTVVKNDIAKAGELLSDSAQILEGGKIETKEEYLSHHFHSDGKFLRAMNRSIDSRSVFIEENTAWVITQNHLQGTYNDRKVNLTSLELAVLKKVDQQWKIAALHWSSSTRK